MTPIKYKLAPQPLSWIMRKFKWQGWCSNWRTVYLLERNPTNALVLHELCHAYQIERDGKIVQPLKWLWYTIWKGYTNNPYEVEARKAEWCQWWAGKKQLVYVENLEGVK